MKSQPSSSGKVRFSMSEEKAQYTPGPWVLDLYNHEYSSAIADAVHVAEWSDEQEDYSESESRTIEANARLIAAAPTIYEALKAVEWLDGGHIRICPSCHRGKDANLAAMPGHNPGCQLRAALDMVEKG